MSIVKRKAGSKDIVKSVLEFDAVPTEGSHNLLESGAVAKAIGNLGQPLQWKGPATVEQLNTGISGIQPGWTYTLTDEGTLTDGNVKVEAGDEVAWTEDGEWFQVGPSLVELKDDVVQAKSDIADIQDVVPEEASESNKLVTKDELDNVQESIQSGFTPKGEISVSDLNDLTTQSNGDQYILTDSGTITDGSVTVEAGDSVAWNSTNSVWYKVKQYALSKYGTDEIKNLPTTITSFRTGDVIPVDGPSGTAKMSKDSLLREAAQNALAGNVAPAFDPDKEGGYKKFEKVVYHGIVYKASNDIPEGTPWSSANWITIGIANYNLKDFGYVAATDDVNDFVSPGVYYTENNATHLPTSGNNSKGFLFVMKIGAGAGATQFFVHIYSGRLYSRTYRAGNWTDWEKVADQYSYYKGAMPATIDTNYTEGLWSVVKAANVSIGGTYPADIDTNKALNLLVIIGSVSNAQNYVYQSLYNLDTNRYYYRTRHLSPWSSWKALATEDFAKKYTDEEILKAVTKFESVYPYDIQKKLFDVNGDEVASNLYSYYYHVVEGDIVKVDLGVFGSSNYSMVSLWKNGAFVKSIVNSPTTASDFVYKIADDVDTMIVSYFANATYKGVVDEDYLNVEKPNLLVLPSSNVIHGVTFSVNENGGVDVSGAADQPQGASFEIDVTLTKGDYILTGMPETSTRYNYAYFIVRADSSYEKVSYDDYKQGYVFSVTADSELVKIYIRVVQQTTIQEDVEFRPMLQSYPPKSMIFLPYDKPLSVKPVYDLIDCSEFNWSGKKMNVIGDSIVEGRAGNWVTIIGNILHLGAARNYGIGGCRLSYYGDGGSVTADDSVVARYSEMSDDADIVIVHAGTNDWASQVPLGNEDSNSNLEFNGALNIIMDGLRAKYPTALIIFSAILDRVDYDSPTHGGSSMPILTSAYSEAIKNQCKRHKMVFFDGYEICGFDFTYDNSHGKYTTSDGLHPNVGGARIFGRKMAGFIKWH